MAYKQYTKCVQPKDFTDASPESWLGKLIIGIGILQVLSIIVLAVLAAATPVSSKPAILLALMLVLEIIAFLTWWLEGRLICLNEEEKNCAIIGRVYSNQLASTFKGGDDDYSMNIILAPGQEHLTAINPKITAIGRGYTSKESYFIKLHCEFEGDGMVKIKEYLYVIAALLTAAYYMPWPMDLILSSLALVIGLIGGYFHFRSPSNASDPGNPLDVNTNLGTLTPGDLVVVKGEWVYDSLHDGWNEIHPVRHCEIVIERHNLDIPADQEPEWSDYLVCNPVTKANMTLDDPQNVKLYRDVWCGLIRDCEEVEYEGSRTNPQNDWHLHPLVDGCKPPDLIL